MTRRKGWRTGIPPSLKERLSDILCKLDIQKDKLESMTERLCQRDSEIFQRCIGAQLTGDENHAKIYANECAEIRKMYTIAKSVQLALERVMLRLETVEQFGETLVHLAPIMAVVKETRSDIVGLVPDVAGELEKVTAVLLDLSTETGQAPSSDLEISVANEEANSVLEESRSIADQRAREQFPILPFEELKATSPVTKEVRLANSNSEQPFLDQVLSYVTSRAGRVSVTECANKLASTPLDVMKAIDQLRIEGKLVAEQETE